MTGPTHQPQISNYFNEGKVRLSRESLPSAAYSQVKDALRDALNGRCPAHLGPYLMFAHNSGSESTIMMHHAGGFGPHKYVIAEAEQNRSIICSAPVALFRYHRNIVDMLRSITALNLNCPGGGYVWVDRAGVLTVDRESTEFGSGDHERVRSALLRAISHTVSNEAQP